MSATLVADVSIPSEIEHQLQDRISDLNMLPAVALEAVEVSKNPDCTIRDVAAIVERDTVLAADIIAVANSALYSIGAPILAVQQALNRLGLRLGRNLILASGMVSMLRKVPLEEEWNRELLTRHGLVTAMTAVRLNKKLNIGYQGEEFTTGLLHDIGRILLAVCLPEQFAQVDQLDFNEGPDLLDRERTMIGTDHCAIGAWFATRHRLPAPIVSAVRWHHLPEDCSEYQQLVALTAVCDHVANHVQQYEGPQGYDPEGNTALALLEESGVRDAARRFCDVYVDVINDAVLDASNMMAP